MAPRTAGPDGRWQQERLGVRARRRWVRLATRNSHEERKETDMEPWVWVVIAIAAVLFLLLLFRGRSGGGRRVVVRRPAAPRRRRRWI